MPNWCQNDVKIVGELDFIIELEKACEEGRLLTFIKPCPEELDRHSAPLNDPELEKKFIEKYGAKDWYDWRVKNWGTKWEVKPEVIQRISNELILSFDSAWAPPLDALNTLYCYEEIESVRNVYFEEGCFFAGVWVNGEDNHIQPDRLTLANTEVGREVDEAYAITNNRNENFMVGDSVVVLEGFNGKEFYGTLEEFYEKETKVVEDGVEKTMVDIVFKVKDKDGNVFDVDDELVEIDF